MAFGKIRRAIYRWRLSRVDRRLPPPTAAEEEGIRRIRAEFQRLGVTDTKHSAPSQSEWLRNLNELREDMLAKDPRGFLRFPVVLKTMFVDRADYLRTELGYLMGLGDWGSSWQRVAQEDTLGHPVPCIELPSSSVNLIHHCYHVARFFEVMQRDPTQEPYILEFGGGYGSLCRVLFKKGFAGRYVIFDLPHFSALQRYFLEGVGIPVLASPKDFRDAVSGVLCISDVDELQALLSELSGGLFIGTWSFSEAPAELRARLTPMIAKMHAYLIAYQSHFNEMDNLDYFEAWPQQLPGSIDWRRIPIPHQPGKHNYLFGVRAR